MHRKQKEKYFLNKTLSGNFSQNRTTYIFKIIDKCTNKYISTEVETQ